MNLGLIAGKSASVLKQIITSHFDSIQVYEYNSIGQFVHETTTRVRILDRIIIVYDVLDVENPTQLITQLNDYLYTHYTTTRIITLGKTKDEVLKELIDANLMMPKMINLCRDKVTPRLICDLASLTQPQLEAAYLPSTVVAPNDKPTTPEKVPQPQAPVSEDPKKKKKKWGLFGRKDNPSQTQVQETEQTEVEAFDPTDTSHLRIKPVFEGTPTFPVPVEEGWSDESDEDLEDTIREDVDIDLPAFSVGDTDDTDSELPDFDTPYEDEIDEIDSIALPVFDMVDDEQVVDEDYRVKHEVETQNYALEDSFEIVGNSPEDPVFEIDLELPHVPTTPTPDIVVEKLPLFGNRNIEQIDIDELPFDMATNLNNEIDIYGDEGATDAIAVNTNIKSKIEELKHRNHSTDVQVEGVQIKPTGTNRRVPSEKLIEIMDNDDTSSFDLGRLEQDYEKTQQPKVIEVQVERIVEVEKIVEKVVQGVSNSSRAYRNGVRSIVVTGDRRSGITRNALNIAGLFASKSQTLFVDMDIDRRGALGYMGFASLLSDEEHVQHSLKYYEKPESLYYLVHHYEAGGFDALLTIYGSDVTDAHISNAQKLLSGQNNYKTIVIDCPIDKLHLLKDIILYSEVIITCEANKGGVLNLLHGLEKFNEDSNFNTFLYKNANFLVTRGKDVVEFTNELFELTEYFGIDETNHNWAKTPILGTEKQIRQIVERL